MGAIYLNGIPYTDGSSIIAYPQIVQVAILPEPSSGNVDTIYQYMGATDEYYINGEFYKCILNDGSYSWKNINTQPISGIFVTADNTLIIAET